MEELKAIIRKLKRRTAPGPDKTPTELLKELEEANLELVLELMNDWWRGGGTRVNAQSKGSTNIQKGGHEQL